MGRQRPGDLIAAREKSLVLDVGAPQLLGALRRGGRAALEQSEPECVAAGGMVGVVFQQRPVPFHRFIQTTTAGSNLSGAV